LGVSLKNLIRKTPNTALVESLVPIALIDIVAGRTDHSGWNTQLLGAKISGPLEIVRRWEESAFHKTQKTGFFGLRPGGLDPP
jgi:hypothetical protein